MKIKIVDNRGYESGKSCNGGCYSFTKTFELMSDHFYRVTYSTSSEFEYCSNCGTFGRYEDHKNCCTEHVKESEIAEELNGYINDKKCEVVNTTIIEDGEIIQSFIIENKESDNLIDEFRSFTKEESKLYEESLAEMFVPTEVNSFDLSK